MDALWRGLKGAMVGVGIAGIMAVAGPVMLIGLFDIPVRRFLALAGLAGFLVGGSARVAARLPQKLVKMLKKVAIVAACATLAIPFAVTALRNWGIEPPDLSYIPPILAGLLGGVFVLVYEAGVAAQSKADVDSENHIRVTTHDNRISRQGCYLIFVLSVVGMFIWTTWAIFEPDRRAERVHHAIRPGASFEDVESLPMGHHFCFYQVRRNEEWQSVSRSEFTDALETASTNASPAMRLNLTFMGLSPYRVSFYVELDHAGNVTNVTNPYGWD